MLISILVHLLKYWLLLGNYFRSLSIDRNSVNEKQVVLKLRRLPGITAYVHSSILAINWFQQALYDDGLWIIDQVRKCFDSILKSSVGEKKVNQFSYFIIIHDFWINKMVINVNNREKKPKLYSSNVYRLHLLQTKFQQHITFIGIISEPFFKQKTKKSLTHHTSYEARRESSVAWCATTVCHITFPLCKCIANRQNNFHWHNTKIFIPFKLLE